MKRSSPHTALNFGRLLVAELLTCVRKGIAHSKGSESQRSGFAALLIVLRFIFHIFERIDTDIFSFLSLGSLLFLLLRRHSLRSTNIK
mgnify:CR=1 FL=1